MKKLAAIVFLAAFGAAARADVTNNIYVVSNIYIRIYETLEREITNTVKVKNTHYNYYYTNNVTTISNSWTVNYTTNINYDVIFDNFGPWVEAASNAANRATAGAVAATNQASVAAGYATLAGSYASSAATAAANALARAQSTQRAADIGMSNLNSKTEWFNERFGEMITNINITYSTTTNIIAQTPVASPVVVAGTTYPYLTYLRLPPATVRPVTGQTEMLGGFKLWLNAGSYQIEHDGLPATLTPKTDKTPWLLLPSYVDYPGGDIAFHYLPTNRVLPSMGYDESRFWLLRDFYWQTNAYTAVIDKFSASTNIIGRWVYICAARGASGGAPLFPNWFNERTDSSFSRTYTASDSGFGIFRIIFSCIDKLQGAGQEVYFTETPTRNTRDYYSWRDSFPEP